MHVHTWVWLVTIAAILAIFAVDLLIVDHKPHEVRTSEAARWVAFYVSLSAVFAVGVWTFSGSRYGTEFIAGYLTEYSLSADNLFVFLILITSFSVPAIYQHKVLLFGVMAALLFRGIFIAIGAAVIESFSWVFYIFGAFLIYTAWSTARSGIGGGHAEDVEEGEGRFVRFVRRFVPVTDDYVEGKVIVKVEGKRMVTPLLLVMLAIGATDLLFALDSIPAIFGLTKEPYLVFTANAFALMGLRQLYFLLGGLVSKLVYLNLGLAVILGFIGVKLILEALHGNGVHVPHISSMLSLGVIVSVLIVTTVASLLKVRRDPAARMLLPGEH